MPFGIETILLYTKHFGLHLGEFNTIWGSIPKSSILFGLRCRRALYYLGLRGREGPELCMFTHIAGGRSRVNIPNIWDIT